jgi:hypothetical protein
MKSFTEQLVSSFKGNPIANMLIIDAIGGKVDEIVENEQEYLDNWPDNHLIDVNLWIDTAKDIKNAMKSITRNG